MPYYTIHTNMDAHPYVYHTNMCIQQSVHVVVHSENPGKNTKRLNLRDYFDRKNNYFYSTVYFHYKSNVYEELLFTILY